MITVYREENKKLIVSRKKNGEALPSIKDRTWIDITVPNLEIITKISKKTKIPLEMLMSSLDTEESAHIDNEDGNTLIVVDVPIDVEKPKKDEVVETFETIPYIIAFNENYIVTICKSDTKIAQKVISKNKRVAPHKHVRLVLLILLILAQQFILDLKKVDRLSRNLEAKLHSSQKNNELFGLMELNKVLVYFSTALNADKVVSEKLKRNTEFQMYEEDFDLMDDVQVELNQAIEMCSIYRGILSVMLDSFSSVINNNLNNVMKVLAIITIVISIPTLVASFFGMNVHLPFNAELSDDPLLFWLIFGGSLALATLGAVLIVFIVNFTKVRRK